MDKSARRKNTGKKDGEAIPNRKDDGLAHPRSTILETHSIKAYPIGTMKIADMRPSPYNPRSISDDALNGLAESLHRFGLVEPIIVNKRSGHIVGGHQRYEVLKQAGEKEASVIVVDLNDKDEKALNVTLNNPNIAGRFTDSLQELLTAIKLEDDGLMETLRLNQLVVDFSPADLGDQGALDKKALVTCPECGHEFES